MRILAILLVGLFATTALAEKKTDWNAWRKRTKKVQSGNFTYYVHTPPRMKKDGTQKYPLLVVLHWSFVNGPAYLNYWHKDGDKHGLIVAAPNSRGGASWVPVDARNIEKMVAELKTKYPVDPTKVWVVGYSAGAVFIYYLLFKYPDLFQVGLPVGGRTKRHRVEAPRDKGAKKTKICLFHGEWDRNIRFKTAVADAAYLRGLGYEVVLHKMKRFGHWIPRGRHHRLIKCFREQPTTPKPRSK
jgi:poly(3-hydroxybutyrate) depolymerase